MRSPALFRGLAILITVTLWEKPFRSDVPARSALCGETGGQGLCEALDGLATALKDPMLRGSRADVLPPSDVPGAINPSVTQANIDETICRPGYARSARPPFATTDRLKRRLMAAHHPGERMADYELDHLIPISIGGAPYDSRDLWLQPRKGQANAGDKNVLAYVLWRLVCDRRVPLKVAQAAISDDWTRAYSTYATPENVARYHFRHTGRDAD